MVRPSLFTSALVAGIVSLGIACSTTPSAPTSPSGIGGGQATAIGDLSLKARAPSLVSPAHDETFESGTTVTLQFQAGTPLYASFTPQHQIVIRNNADGQTVYDRIVDGTGTVSHTLPEVPAGSFEWRVRTVAGDGAGAWTEARTFTMKAATRGPVSSGRRTPDPPPGVRLPAPDMFPVVAAVANQYYGFLLN